MSNVLDEVAEVYEPSPELLSAGIGGRSAILLSLDIGTSGTRAAMFDEVGNEVPGASVRLNRKGSLGETEATDAHVLSEHVAETIDALFANYYQPAQIELIAISCFWHSLLGVDEAGAPTTPLFGWSDLRSTKAAQQLRDRFNEKAFHSITGCRFHPSYWPAKLLRIKSEAPSAYRATKRWLSFSEFLSEQLCGDSTISVSMASGTGLMNQRTCDWHEDLLKVLDVEVEKLPEIARPGQTYIRIADRYRSRWPQLRHARLTPAIGDGAANNIGSGCTDSGKMALMVGTSGAMRVLHEGAPPHRLNSALWCYRADRNRVLVGGALSDGGNLYGWIRNSLLADYNSDAIENQLSTFEPDAHGLTLLPFWAGERSPGWALNARGSIHHLTLQTRPIEILRAAMEAVAYRFALIASSLQTFAPEAQVFASGHALRSSPVWIQILADVLGRCIIVSELPEASTRGAALLALEAAGKIQAIEDFVCPVESVTEPDMSRHARYCEGLKRQQEFYEQTMPTTGW